MTPEELQAERANQAQDAAFEDWFWMNEQPVKRPIDWPKILVWIGGTLLGWAILTAIGWVAVFVFGVLSA